MRAPYRRHPVLAGAFAIVVLAAPLVAPARSAVPPNLLLNNPSPPGSFETQCTPVIRSYGDKVVAVWTDVRVGGTTENKFHYAVSVDSGATFIDAGQPPNFSSAGVPYVWRNNPQLAINSSNGKVFMAGCALSQSGPSQLALAVVEGTFSGGTLNWSIPVFIRLVGQSAADATGSVSMEVVSTGLVGSLHILIVDTGAIRYLRSSDGDGLLWNPAVVLSSVSDQNNVAFPKLVAGGGNILHAAWSAGVTVASQPIRFRTSPDLGATWNPEETPATIRANPEYPGLASVFLSSRRSGFSMAANRIAGSDTFARVALAWGETWDFSDEPFPALIGTVLHNEVEPNDDAAGAGVLPIGDALFGTKSSETDVDFWKVTLSAGNSVLIWGDSTNYIPNIRVIDTDGSTPLINGFGTAAPASAFAFRAPYDGTFYLQIGGGTAGSFYRVRTRFGSPTPADAQDSRDITVAYKDFIGGWSAPRHWPLGPIGYDDYLPTIGWGADGLDYVTWYDLSRVPGQGSKSHLVVARNLLGFDPNFSLPEIVTTAPTDWGFISVFSPPSMGPTNDVWTDPRRLHLAWADGREHNPDAYAASLATTAAIVSCPADTMVSAGTTALLRIGVVNRNPVFQEKGIVAKSGARAWPVGLSEAFVGAGTTGYLIVPIAVPDTAAPGVYPLTLTVKRQSGMPLGSCQVSLTITSATGIADPRGPRFGLGPITPNPARERTQVEFALAERGTVQIAVYGIQGNRVRTLVDSERDAGAQSVTWDGRDDRGSLAPTGMYFIRLQAFGRTATRPVLILR